MHFANHNRLVHISYITYEKRKKLNLFSYFSEITGFKMTSIKFYNKNVSCVIHKMVPLFFFAQ